MTEVARPDVEKEGSDARVPPEKDEQEALIDEASEESFPASDPPSYWARDVSEDDEDPG